MLRSVATSVILEVIPVMIGATGNTSKSFRRYLNNIPGKHITELQKTVTLSAAHKLESAESAKHSTWEIALHVARN
jgi:hypothetical protein